MNKNVLEIFSGSDVEWIAALIEKMEKSAFDYLKLEGGGLKIVIGKNGVTEVSEAAPAKAEQPAQASTVIEASPEPTPSAVEAQPGVAVIKSPSYGMFYAQADPSSPPYVSVGGKVIKGDTIGLIEIMKTYNAVTSEVDGEVVAIHAKNEQILEPGTPLISVKLS